MDNNANSEQEVVTDTPQQSQSKETKKIIGAYTKVMGSLTEIFQDESNIKPVRQIGSETIPLLMQEMYKEEEEVLRTQFKEGAKGLMVAKVAYDRFLKTQEVEMQKAKNKKMKEFTVEATRIVQLVSKIEDLPKHYANALSPVTDGSEE